MSSTPVSERPLSPPRRSNRTVVLICVGVFVAMVAAAYAAVPLYRAFCQATGFAGTTRRATKAPGQVLAQKLTVGFDTNVRGLPWTFKPVQTSQTLQIGDTGLAFFTVTNNSNHALTGRAAYNVAPDQAGAYFRKLQCFCFNDQTIPAHTTMKFPVVYFVDPKFASDPDTKGFSTVTLSYTFFPVAPPATKTPQGLGGAAGGRL
jgi:cytochrome c oxidase assembly protein subunit 11